MSDQKLIELAISCTATVVFITPPFLYLIAIPHEMMHYLAARAVGWRATMGTTATDVDAGIADGTTLRGWLAFRMLAAFLFVLWLPTIAAIAGQIVMLRSPQHGALWAIVFGYLVALMSGCYQDAKDTLALLRSVRLSRPR